MGPSRISGNRLLRGGVCYIVNRNHPFVSEVMEALDERQRRLLERLLAMFKVGLPVAAIYADMANDQSVEMPPEQACLELSMELNSRLRSAGDDPYVRDVLIGAIPSLDPFSMYPDITRKLIEDLRDAKH